MLNVEMLIVITDRSAAEDFVQLFQEHALPLTLAAHGKGTATREMLDMFSLEESRKSVLISVAGHDKIRHVMRDITRKLGIASPGTSVVFAIPLSSIGGSATSHHLADDKAIERKEYSMSTDAAFELIVVITNEGYSGMVMDAAREKGGATGGTILHARGIGSEKAQKFFGISISDEKEMLLIACRSRCRNKIMQAIIEEAGNASKARSIVFSVPISCVAGLWTLEDDDEVD
ncbi:MAG: P-II family nitrogen regulator [Lachnospiraceae bacterium]|jgi:nitrogen regulatory protein PII|nr:P-II family nitrogen regulator [Lachnospiraceae bacterium]